MSHKDDINVLSGRLHRIIGQLCDLEGDMGIIHDELDWTCTITNTTVAWNDDVHTTALCSECGEEYTVDFGYLNYCPNCGARVVSE